MMLKTQQVLCGRFEIEAFLGRGGMAEVYLARDLRLGGKLCVKALLPHLRAEPRLRARFEREVAAVRGLDHPNIVRIFELLEDGELLFFTMQHIEGMDLKKKLRLRGALPIEECRSIAAAVADALASAHERGIVHRDVKPQNILVGSDGSVKLVDFGLAHMSSLVGLSIGSMAMGTPLYSAPELLTGGPCVDPRADLYSLGVVIYEMITGETPFQGTTFYDLLRRQVEEAPPAMRPKRPDAPAELEAVARRALAKDPEDRFQTAQEMREALLDRQTGLARAEAAPPLGQQSLCPRCSRPYVPALGLCLECGHEPLAVVGVLDGPYSVYLKPEWSLGHSSYRRPRWDPLTYDQKWKLVQLLQELAGPTSLSVEDLDLRLRRLPALLCERVSLDAARQIQRRLEGIGVRSQVVHRFSPYGFNLSVDNPVIGAGMAILMLPIVLSLSLPGVHLGALFTMMWGVFGLALAAQAFLQKPLLRLPRGSEAGLPVGAGLVSQAREVLPRLRSPRLRSLARRVLALALELRRRLETGAFPELAEERATVERLGERAIGLAGQIQELEEAVAAARESELVESLQQLDARIDEERDPELVDSLILERAAQARGLESLEEAQRTVSALYGQLIQASAVLGGMLGRLGSAQGRLASANRELPALLARIEANQRKEIP